MRIAVAADELTGVGLLEGSVGLSLANVPSAEWRASSTIRARLRSLPFAGRISHHLRSVLLDATDLALGQSLTDVALTDRRPTVADHAVEVGDGWPGDPASGLPPLGVSRGQNDGGRSGFGLATEHLIFLSGWMKRD